MNLNITVIGLGGVGTILIERLCRFLNYSADYDAELLLVDGDTSNIGVFFQGKQVKVFFNKSS